MMENAEVEDLDWFHPNLNRHHAEALLIQNGEDGSYLLRNCTSHGAEYSLSCKSSNSVRHFQIGWDGAYYTFGMARFSSLKDFVKHFENKPLIGGEVGVLMHLKFPYPRDIEEPDYYETIHVHAEWGDRPLDAQVHRPESINSKEGYLTKQGLRVKNWKERWFVLCRNELKYYKTKGENSPIRILNLNNCLSVDEDNESGKLNSMRINMPDRTFFMYASSEYEKNEWLDILKWKMQQKHNSR